MHCKAKYVLLYVQFKDFSRFSLVVQITDEELLQSLYKTLEEIRVYRGLSMQKFSEAIGKHRNWYSQAVKEKRDIGYCDFMKLAKLYGIKISDISIN